MSRHRFEDARALALRVIALNPESPVAYGNLSDALLELGRFDEAKKAAQTMVDKKPTGYGIPEIREYCADEIAKLRSIVVGGTTRELWVRERTDEWHRYLITDDAVETVPDACGIVVPVPGEGSIPAARMESPRARPGNSVQLTLRR